MQDGRDFLDMMGMATNHLGSTKQKECLNNAQCYKMEQGSFKEVINSLCFLNWNSPAEQWSILRAVVRCGLSSNLSATAQ